ncbi:unnamed protein product [Gongylonema pulchrum]|uniref:MuDRA-like transposase n=1 Tax=Gongylonema pulchrum TaxID=637853 RepID=A0A183EN80_9BILA|nr:unnamed protein product [Gongylonema pulchrum]
MIHINESLAVSDVGSEYVRKLHYIGQKMKNVATTKIWFGGKTCSFIIRFVQLADTTIPKKCSCKIFIISPILRLKVRDLLHEVGSKCGVEPSVIDNIDLDNVIEQAIAKNVG